MVASPESSVFACKCPACGHECNDTAPLAATLSDCSECGARIAYGRVQPRCTVQPLAEDRRFCVVRFEAPGQEPVEYVLVNRYARAIGLNIESITRPE